MIRPRLLAAALVLSTTALTLPAAAQTPAPSQTPDPADREPVGRALLFFALDRNNDGAIDEGELQAVRGALFDALDADKNGTLTREEALDGLPGRGPGWGRMGMGRMGMRNHDGHHGWRDRDDDDQAAAPDDEDRPAMGDDDEGDDRGDDRADRRAERRERMMERREERRQRMAERREERQKRILDRIGFGDGDTVTRTDFVARPTPVFERADTNDDKRVSRAEFMVLGPHVIGFFGPLAR